LIKSKSSIRQIVFATLDAVLPPSCVLCGAARETPGFCDQCEFSLLHSWPPNGMACRNCGLPRPREPVPAVDEPCSGCRGKTFGFDEVIALAIYQEAVREAVVAAKLARHAPLATALGDLLANRVQENLRGTQALRVTFVPSHITRRLQRAGIGGVATMASVVARRLGKKSEPLLRMTRRVKKQSMLADPERPANVRGAFAIRNRYALQDTLGLQGQEVLLVDDVLTTGSTASEIAGVLKEAGAAKVTLAVVARAVRR
jgi:predicted amidophosphoribosyltransferase